MKSLIGIFIGTLVIMGLSYLLKSPALMYTLLSAVCVVSLLYSVALAIKWHKEVKEAASQHLADPKIKLKLVLVGLAFSFSLYAYVANNAAFMEFAGEETFQTGCQFALYGITWERDGMIFERTVDFCKAQVEYGTDFHYTWGLTNPLTSGTWGRWWEGADWFTRVKANQIKK